MTPAQVLSVALLCQAAVAGGVSEESAACRLAREVDDIAQFHLFSLRPAQQSLSTGLDALEVQVNAIEAVSAVQRSLGGPAPDCVLESGRTISCDALSSELRGQIHKKKQHLSKIEWFQQRAFYARQHRAQHCHPSRVHWHR